MTRTSPHERGFTLVEIIVATGLFASVMLIAVGSLMSVIDANRKSQSQQIVLNNLSAVLESVSRNIRTGALYHCGSSGTLENPQDCANGGTFLAFKPREAIANPATLSGKRWIYRHTCTSGSPGPSCVEGYVEVSKDNGSSYERLTAPEIDVQGFTFYVAGSCPKTGVSGCDNLQPRALITMYGTAAVSAKTRTTFNVQTSVTQRLFDI